MQKVRIHLPRIGSPTDPFPLDRRTRTQEIAHAATLPQVRTERSPHVDYGRVSAGEKRVTSVIRIAGQLLAITTSARSTRGPIRPGARLRSGRRERSSPRRSPWAEQHAVRNTTCCQLGRPVPRTPSMGQPIQGLTPDRSRIRPKSRPTRRPHPTSRAVGAGAPPRLGKGHPSSATRARTLP